MIASDVKQLMNIIAEYAFGLLMNLTYNKHILGADSIAYLLVGALTSKILHRIELTFYLAQDRVKACV